MYSGRWLQFALLHIVVLARGVSLVLPIACLLVFAHMVVMAWGVSLVLPITCLLVFAQVIARWVAQ